MKRRLIFRTNANSTIGRGHLSRSMAIAEMLEGDFDVLFVSDEENKEYIERLEIPYEFHVVSSNEDFFSFVSDKDIVWLDGYTFSEEFKANLRVKIFKLIETNDLPYKVQNVDLLFNHTPGIKQDLFSVSDESTQLYLGLNYALLRGAFLDKAKNYRQLEFTKGVFVCFGGADFFNLGWRFVQGLVENGFQDPIYWVSNKKKDELPKLAENVHLMWGLNSHEMINYMNKSKVLLIPSSVLSFEAIALRRPFYTGYFVDNQELISKGLKVEELAVGCRNLEISEEFEKALVEFLAFYSDEAAHQKLIKNQEKSIDGNSNGRIRDVLLEVSKPCTKSI